MTSCPLCHSELPGRPTACPFCGTLLAPPQAEGGVAPSTAQRAVDAAREAIVQAEDRGADAAIARGLLQRALAALGRGDARGAEELAAAAKRASLIAVRRSKVEGAIQGLEAKLAEVEAAAGPAGDLEAAVAEARAALARGEFQAAQEVVERAAPMADTFLAFQRGRRAIEEARERIEQARAKGVDVGPYVGFVAQAEEALAESDMEALEAAVGRLARALDFAQRMARAQQRMAKLDEALEEAQHRGLDTSRASGLVAQARRALKAGLYADVERLLAEASQVLAEAKARGRLGRAFERAQAALREEAREGGDTARGNELLAAAEALATRGNVRAAQAKLTELMALLRAAAAQRRAREMVEYLEREVKELREMGADADRVAEAAARAREALAAGHGAGLKKAFARGKRLAHEARLRREREILVHTVEEIVERVGSGGVSTLGTQELLAQVREAVGAGKVGDLEELVRAKFNAEKAKKEREVAEALGELAAQAEAFREAGFDPGKLEAEIAAAREALQRDRPWQAAEMIPKLRAQAEPLAAALREAAARELDRARAALDGLGGLGIELTEGRELLRRAEAEAAAGRDGRTVELARAVLALAERVRRERGEEIARREAERQKAEEAARDLGPRLDALAERVARLKGAGAPVEALEADVARARAALGSGALGEALLRAQLAEDLARGMEEALGRMAQEALGRAVAALAEARARGLTPGREEDLLRSAQGALAEGQFREALRLAQEAILALQAPRPSAGGPGAGDGELRGLEQRVRGLLEELKRAGIDISGGEQNLEEASTALARGDLDQARAILTELEEMANNLKASFVEAALDFIAKAKAVVEGAQKLSIAIPEGDQMVREAQEMFKAGHYDKAVELAKLAERRARSTLMAYIDEAQGEVQDRVEASRGRIRRLRKTLKDLARADISIEGADEAIAAAQEALDEGDFEAIDAALATVEEMARGLAAGLRVAAHDLLERTRSDVVEAKAQGFPVPRAEQVLGSAMEAWGEERYVEALEYCKVIEDILQDARLKREAAALAARLAALREAVAASAAAGLPTAEAEALLARALEASEAGHVERLRDLTAGLEQGVARLREEAAARAAAEAERLGHELEAARAEGLDVAAEEGELARARASLTAGRPEEALGLLRTLGSRLAGRTAGRVQEALGRAVDEYLASLAPARALGVGLGPVDALLARAREAAARGARAEVEGLLGEAQGEARRLIAAFAAAHRPDVALTLPVEPLQEGRWNRLLVGVENRGDLAACGLTVALEGEADVRPPPPLGELRPGERQALEAGVRPGAPGELLLRATARYASPLDEAPREATAEARIEVSPRGTYVVEDLFLIHGDGRLIAHESRRYYKGVDEDIFSGMLTIVQDFVRDSFRQTTGVGLKRLDFGDSKILIERGAHVYLAAVVHGEEPRLLPLYMAEVIRDIEVALGEKLEHWSGLMNDLPGVSEIIQRLFALTGPGGRGRVRGSIVASAHELIEGARALGADVTEAEAALSAAARRIEEDVVSALPLVEEAVEKALRVQEAWRGKLQASIASLTSTLAELRATGAETSQLEAKVQEAWEALGAGELEKARAMLDATGEQLAHLRGAVVGGTLKARVEEAEAALGELAAAGEEVGALQGPLGRAKEALAAGDVKGTQEALAALLPALEGRRREARGRAAARELQGLEAEAGELARLAPLPPPVTGPLAEAKEALARGDVDGGTAALRRAREALEGVAGDLLRERHPRVFVRAAAEGLQSNRWNRAILEVANRGNWAARDLEFQVLGDVEVKGLAALESLAPNEVRRIEIGLKPNRRGTLPVDVEVSYARLLDRTRFTVRDSRDLAVEAPGTYPVADVFLLLPDGRIAAHEGRAYREVADREGFAAVLQGLEQFAKDSFRQRRVGLRRIDLGPRKVLLERGPREALAAVVDGDVPRLLPLYMVEALNEIDTRVGGRLAAWDGQPLEEVGPILRRLLLVTEVRTADVGDLQESPITAAAGGTTAGEELPRPLASALAAAEQRDYGEALQALRAATQPYAGQDNVASQVRERALAVAREGGNVQIDDASLQAYIEFLKKVDRAIKRARAKANLDPGWPLRKIAVRTTTEEMANAVRSFAPVILRQGNAKELDVVRPGEIWRGLDLKMEINTEAIARAYKVWAKKIELILKSQDPWKIRSGLERGEYSLGVEGMKVKLTPEMVSFTPLLPPHVVIQEFDSGIVYLDTKVTPEVKAEGIAQEIARLAREAREEMGLPPRARLALTVAGASEELGRLLGSLREGLLREAGAAELRFAAAEEATEGVVVECDIAGERFTLVIRPAAGG